MQFDKLITKENHFINKKTKKVVDAEWADEFGPISIQIHDYVKNKTTIVFNECSKNTALIMVLTLFKKKTITQKQFT